MPACPQAEYRAGKPISTGKYTLIPITKSWQVRIGRFPGGLIWNRPSSILVQDPGGVETNLPIPDPTRRIILSLLGLCIGAAGLLWVISRNQMHLAKE